MKAKRLFLALLPLAAFGACGDGTAGPVTADITAPIGLAGASQRICSGLGTEIFDGTNWVQAELAPIVEYPWDPGIAGSNWVTPDPNSYPAAGTYHFRSTFVLPADAKGLTLTGTVHADNQAIISLNGTEFYRQVFGDRGTPYEYVNYQDPEDVFQTRSGFIEGAPNTIEFDLVNWGPEPNAAGLDFCYSLSYSSQSDTTSAGGGGSGGVTNCPSSSSVTNQILKDLGVKGNRADNVVSAVAARTTQKGEFDGLDKCDPDFKAAITTFVTAYLASH